MESSRVWVLLSSRFGANHQALALAEALGLPFEAKALKHNRLRRFGHRLGATRLTIDRLSRRELLPPWPDLVIAVSRANVPVARWIRARSMGKTKTLFLGNPRVDPGHFDLIVTTPDHLRPRGENVLVLPLPPALRKERSAEEPAWCADLPAPRLLLLIGGPVKYWDLTKSGVAAAVSKLADKANERSGSVIVSGSPRTPDALLETAKRVLSEARHGRLAPARKGGLDALLGFATEIFVTGDSMAMVTEAILTGKPVGILPAELNENGRYALGKEPAPEGSDRKRRDLRRFWNSLWAQELAGTIDEPNAAAIEPPAVVAARWVRKRLDSKTKPSLDRSGHLTHGKPR